MTKQKLPYIALLNTIVYFCDVNEDRLQCELPNRPFLRKFKHLPILIQVLIIICYGQSPQGESSQSFDMFLKIRHLSYPTRPNVTSHYFYSDLPYNTIWPLVGPLIIS